MPIAWVISDHAAGNARQADALARALAHVRPLELRTFKVALREPWRSAAPRLTTLARWAVPRAQRWELTPPWPALAIGCGRQAALLTRALREWSGGATYSVQILDPRIDTAQFDLVIAPRHDALSGTNVIAPVGSLNPVDTDWLAAAKMQFSTLQQLPEPRTALLVGGPRRGLALDTAWLERLIANVQAWLAREHGSVLIALSRRTPPEWAARLRGAFRHGCSYFWGDARDGENPYAGYLAWAERFVVTPDSVNMLSEACATGRPVYTLLPETAQGKLLAFHAELRAHGLVRPLDAENSTFTPAPALRETAAIAMQVWRRWDERLSVSAQIQAAATGNP